jgi:hypothetical protein
MGCAALLNLVEDLSDVRCQMMTTACLWLDSAVWPRLSVVNIYLPKYFVRLILLAREPRPRPSEALMML